jgi:hypothetical protein
MFNLFDVKDFYCDVCRKLLTFHQISYCSNACKMKAYRKRKKALLVQHLDP